MSHTRDAASKPSYLTASPLMVNPMFIDPNYHATNASDALHTYSHRRQTKYISDGSGPLFSLYLKKAEEEDEKKTDSWRGDADSILIFVCGRNYVFLFYASLAWSSKPVCSQASSRLFFRRPMRTFKQARALILSLPSTLHSCIKSQSLATRPVPSILFLTPLQIPPNLARRLHRSF